MNFPGKSLTRKSFAVECDVNNIVRKYKATGELLHVNPREGVYMDATGFGDYIECRNKIRLGEALAEQLFERFTPGLRSMFPGGPRELLEQIGNPENHARLKAMGVFGPQEPKDEPKAPGKGSGGSETGLAGPAAAGKDAVVTGGKPEHHEIA